jgi:hypothetical protein
MPPSHTRVRGACIESRPLLSAGRRVTMPLMRMRILLLPALFIGGTVFGEPLLDPTPFTMRVVDDAGHGVAGLRIVTDNGIVCFTRLDGNVSWSESSLMRRDVRVDVQDQSHIYDDAAATRHFKRGGKTTIVVHHTSGTS